MREVIGELLGNAGAAAIAPLPLIALSLLLMSSHPIRSGLSYLVGWFVGNGLPAALAIMVGVGVDGRSEQRGGAWVNLVLGVLLVAMAVRTFRGRPRAGEPVKTPGWMKSLDTASPARVAVIGLALALVNAKNLPLSIAAGTLIAGSGLSDGSKLILLATYCAIASISILLPIVYRIAAGDRAAAKLEKVGGWLMANNASIMTALFFVMGLSTFGNGLAAVG